MDLPRLLALAAEGRQDAWREVVESFAPRVFGLLARQCGDPDLAEEITQITFVKVIEQLGRLGGYQELGRFEAWLFRVAMNGLRDELRRRKRQARTTDFGPGSAAGNKINPRVPGENADPADRAERAEQVELLRRAVKELSEQDQKILHLRHTAGLSFAQIAETLEEPLGTVLARAHRALGKLRAMLDSSEK